jgi:hypothetical protein
MKRRRRAPLCSAGCWPDITRAWAYGWDFLLFSDLAFRHGQFVTAQAFDPEGTASNLAFYGWAAFVLSGPGR